MNDVSSPLEPADINADDVHRVLRSRRTVHDFQSERVPEDLIMQAIETARWAPNHHRTEPWHFYILGEKSRSRIAELNAKLVRESKGERAAAIKLKRWSTVPGWLVLTCVRRDDPVRCREDYAACCCAAQNLMLYLWAEGIGVKWTTGRVTTLDAFYAAAGIVRDREYVVGLFWYGRPSTVIEQYRKPVDSVIERID